MGYISDITCILPEGDIGMRILKTLPPLFIRSYLIGSSQSGYFTLIGSSQSGYFFSYKGMEGMGISKYVGLFWYKKGDFSLVLPFLMKKKRIPTFGDFFFRIPIAVKTKLKPR